MTLTIVPISFSDAAEFVRQHHRHHPPSVGHKFSVAVASSEHGDIGGIVGVAVVGRPVARHLDDAWTLEVTRSCTDSTPHVNSMLYAACWRATKALGYRRLVTYTRADEAGTSLRAAGWRVLAVRSARKGWSCPTRPRIDKTGYDMERVLWEAI